MHQFRMLEIIPTATCPSLTIYKIFTIKKAIGIHPWMQPWKWVVGQAVKSHESSPLYLHDMGTVHKRIIHTVFYTCYLSTYMDLIALWSM